MTAQKLSDAWEFGEWARIETIVHADGSIDCTVTRIDSQEIYKSADGKRASYRMHSDMLMADAAGMTEENRYRDCIETGCGKSFRKTSETEFRCESCRAKLKAEEHKGEIGEALLGANKVFR
jgi:hypothetical protein